MKGAPGLPAVVQGLRAAIRLAGVDQAAVESVMGTSAAMIKEHYYKTLVDRLREKLKGRRSF